MQHRTIQWLQFIGKKKYIPGITCTFSYSSTIAM